ncbi:Outer membrane efflux protein [Rubripirellula reticaptiva]|uniref:Outer membrane efflux protein n=1 Tax=Rubripirellula reticaptiva TaxID=2528013 RepID=A0A5C6EFF8_9BACT|nr:Outer membrane efflux protein [Rubripirellula reticaptiva]
MIETRPSPGKPTAIAKRRALLLCILLASGCHAGSERFASTPISASQPKKPTIKAPARPLVSLVGFREDDQSKGGESGRVGVGENNDTNSIDSKMAISDLRAANLPTPLLPISVTSPRPDLLPELIATALSTHPSIAAARQRVAAAQHRIPQATALEDPMVGNTFWPIHDQALQTAGGRVAHQFALTQKLPWPAKLDARGAVAAREVQVALAEIADKESEIVEAVRLAYYELWLASELIRIVDDNNELVQDLITVAEARYKTGGSQQDILRAELEGDRLAQQLISLRRQQEQARADLGTLVRMPLDYMPTAVTDLDVDEAVPQLDLLVAQAERCNPTLRGLAAEIARDRAKESLACLQQYPDFQLGLGYSIISDNQDVISPVANGHDNINFTVGVTLPIWRDKINAGVSEAAHNRSSTTLRQEAERDRLRGTLRRQVASAYAAIEQHKLFRERLIPRTEQTLEITTADYQGKKADFTDLIATYRELLSLQVQVARTEATLASTLAGIERTVGCQ